MEPRSRDKALVASRASPQHCVRARPHPRMGTWRQGRLSIPLLGILIILRLAPYAACFKPFRGVETLKLNPGPSARLVLDCASNKNVNRLRDGFETQFQPSFGWIEVLGEQGRGLGMTLEAEIQKCLFLSAVAADGRPFDDKCKQRAFLTAFLTKEPPPTKPCPEHSSSNPQSQSQCTGSGEATGAVPGTWGEAIEHAVNVAYHPLTAIHSVCFRPVLPGQYRLSVYLRYTNAFVHWFPQGHSGDAYEEGYAGTRLVLSRLIDVRPGAGTPVGAQGAATVAAARAAARAVTGAGAGAAPRAPALQMCTLQMLRHQRAEGVWEGGLEWSPAACQLRRVSPQEAFACLARKKEVLLLGDEKMATIAVLLLAYLFAPSRAAFLDSLKHPLGWALCQTPNIFKRCKNLPSGPASPENPGGNSWSGRYLLMGYTRFGNLGKGGRNVTFRARGCKGYLRTLVATPRAFLRVPPVKRFNLTFVSHLGKAKDVIPFWMVKDIQGTLSPKAASLAPTGPPTFEAVLAGTMTSDAGENNFASYPAYVLPKLVLPELLKLAGSPGKAIAGRRITMLGPWAPLAVEGQGPSGESPPPFGQTLPRLTFFEDAARVVLQDMGYNIFLPTLLMSSRGPPPAKAQKSARRIDMARCASAFAALEVWLATTCAQG